LSSEKEKEGSKRNLPQILEIKTVAQTKIFHIESVSLRFSNGEEREFERLKRYEPGIVMIIPFLSQDTVLLVQEYAAGVHDYNLTLPKGRVEPGEDILTAANRELQEEIGYKANKLTYLCALTNAPHYSPTQAYVVLAEDLTPSVLEADEPEPLVVVPWHFHQLSDLIKRPDFHEARAIAALYLAKEYRESHDK
jgi:ADP-ribose diphosphatase